MDTDRNIELLVEELRQLGNAAWQMQQRAGKLCVPLPRWRRFVLAKGVIWPHVRQSDVEWGQITDKEMNMKMPIAPSCSNYVFDLLIRATRRQPRKILRVLRRIQAARAWVEARIRGMERAAAEVKRQQARAEKVLEAEKALSVLFSVNWKKGDE